MDQEFKFIECPRDAMQGFSKFIATDKKIRYINQLLKVGFHTIDFGSFVSERYVPQMKDTEEVLASLDLTASSSGLLTIVVNTRGAQRAVEFEKIKYLGYPLSVSETFQRNNANMSIEESLILLEQLQELCLIHGKELVVYVSMSFGNHYSDPYHTDVVMEMIKRLDNRNIGVVSLADTVGIATPDEIFRLLS
ncbi:MAG: hydroxymethylglutaryl-CoA lyase, partial [Cyclobacteriaceae bacterium]|nr:hydroxymethylglutaryl-CoA lyase [Cyclobacteriaceae bacterium]